MKLYNSFALDGYYRPYWAEWDSVAVKTLDALADLAGCLEPRFYRAPTEAIDQLAPFGYLSYTLTLLPGSYILGFMHTPQPYTNQATLELLSATGDGLLFTAVATGAGGNAISVNIPPPAGPGQVLAVAVVGNAITITPASDANSLVTSTNTQVAAAITASVPASALVTCIIIGDPSALTPLTPLGAENLAGGGLVANQTNYVVQITDLALDHRFFSNPIRDDYLSGKPALLECPYPVVVPGNFLVEFWNTSETQDVTAQLIFIVNEPVPHDLINAPAR